MEKLLELKSEGNVNIEDLGLDRWNLYDPGRVRVLCLRAEEVGVALVNVKEHEYPFEYTMLDPNSWSIEN